MLANSAQDRDSFLMLNAGQNDIPYDFQCFQFSAGRNTELWREPPFKDTSTAPLLYKPLRFMFTSAEVSVSADWEKEWDQAGLVIFTGDPATNTSSLESTASTRQLHGPPSFWRAMSWAKIGLEYRNGVCNAASAIASTNGADYCLTALPLRQTRRSELRLKFERVGISLWCSYEDPLYGWRKMREVTWFFWDVQDKDVRVGIYVSRPANTGQVTTRQAVNGVGSIEHDLHVQFDGLQIY